MNDTKRCPRCDGCGHVPIPPELQQTINLLRERGPLTVGDVEAELDLGVARTAINNRLEDLRALGLLTRTKVDGNRWLYRIADGSGAS